MKIVIDIPDEDYEFIKDMRSVVIGGRGGCKTIQYNVINAIMNGTPVKTVTNAEEAEAYQLPECKECRTCKHCMMNKKLPKTTWKNGYPFIFCSMHHEHFAPSDTCEFYKERDYGINSKSDTSFRSNL